MTFFWTLLLTEMLTYVVGSMNGVEFAPIPGLIIAVAFTVLVFVITALIPNEPTEQH